MRAMILAAGRGERMRALTQACPKPLIEVAGRALIEHQILRLREAGFVELVINLAYLGELIRARLGDGRQFGVTIRYSDEGDEARGTGGGIRRALPLLGSDPVLVVNADIWTDFPYERLRLRWLRAAHLVLVPNPAHVVGGDFALRAGTISRNSGPRFTFSGMGVYDPELFAGEADETFSLVRPLDVVAPRRMVTG